MRTSVTSTLAFACSDTAAVTRRQDFPLGPRVEVDFHSLHHSSACRPSSFTAASSLLLFIACNPILALRAAEEACSPVMAARLTVIPADAQSATSIFLHIARFQICCCGLRIKRHQLLYDLSDSFTPIFIGLSLRLCALNHLKLSCRDPYNQRHLFCVSGDEESRSNKCRTADGRITLLFMICKMVHESL